MKRILVIGESHNTLNTIVCEDYGVFKLDFMNLIRIMSVNGF